MDELLLLIQAHLDGTLSAEETRKLETRLMRDPQVLEVYVDTLRIDQQLRNALPSEQTSLRIEQILANSEAKQKPELASAVRTAGGRVVQFFTRPTPFSMTVAALVMGLLITVMAVTVPPFYRAWTNRGEPGGQPSYQIVAQVTATHNAIWGQGGLAAYKNAHLIAGS